MEPKIPSELQTGALTSTPQPTPVGIEDIGWGSGLSTDTYTVTLTDVPALDGDTSSRIKGKWFVSSGAGIDHGDGNTEGSLKWVLDLVGTAKATIELPGGHSYGVGSDLTIPENVTLACQRGAVLVVASDVTLTVNGCVEAGPWEIFGGNGAITGVPVADAVYPEWFGAIGDGTSNDAAAITRTIVFAADRLSVVFLGRKYAVTTPIAFHPQGCYRGVAKATGSVSVDRTAIVSTYGQTGAAFTLDAQAPFFQGAVGYSPAFSNLVLGRSNDTGPCLFVQDIQRGGLPGSTTARSVLRERQPQPPCIQANGTIEILSPLLYQFESTR